VAPICCAVALHVQQALDQRRILLGGRQVGLREQALGLLGAAFGLGLDGLVARRQVTGARLLDLGPQRLLFVALQQPFDALLQLGRFARAGGRLGGEEFAQRRVGALDDGGGAARGAVHVAVPVADHALHGQGLVRHVARGLRDGAQPPYAERGHQRHQQQDQGEAAPQAGADIEVLHGCRGKEKGAMVRAALQPACAQWHRNATVLIAASAGQISPGARFGSKSVNTL
jgi:hypothetical protein